MSHVGEAIDCMNVPQLILLTTYCIQNDRSSKITSDGSSRNQHIGTYATRRKLHFTCVFHMCMSYVGAALPPLTKSGRRCYVYVVCRTMTERVLHAYWDREGKESAGSLPLWDFNTIKQALCFPVANSKDLREASSRVTYPSYQVPSHILREGEW